MRIEKVNVYKIHLFFKGDFSISRLEGLSSDVIVVEMVAENGRIKGYGEGIPVERVTGETPETALENVMALVEKDSFPWELNELSQVWEFVESLPDGKASNAAICGTETALLDILARKEGKSIIEYFPKDFYTHTVHYGAAITLGNRQRVTELCTVFSELGISDLRVKMGKDLDQNREAMETVTSLFGDSCELRIDPNGVWDGDLAFRHLPLIEQYNVHVVEEPMPWGDPCFEGFVEAVRSKNAILMACESAPTLEDVESIIEDGNYHMINVKLSRSGGFRRSLKIIERIRNSGLSFQIGCTLGESGILSAAGRALCLLCGDALYYDGSYDKFLLRENVTSEHVDFGPGGEAGPLDGPGLGVEVDTNTLKRLSGGHYFTIYKP